MVTRPYSIKKPRAKKEVEEFAPAPAGLLACPQCQALYFQKSWHHQLKGSRFSQAQPRRSVLCPACQMIKEKKFEGELILHSVPLARKKELRGLIKHIGQRAYQRDPLDRIIGLEEKGSQWRILTTENQLALGLAKQIKKAFKGRIEISWSDREDIVRINWFAPEKND